MATDLGTTVPSWSTDSFEDDLDRVRLEIYEETKGMTPKERQVYMMRETESIIKQYGLRTISVDEVRARGGFPPLKDVKPLRR
ncbi:MAG: hypothetical protein LBR38_07955 [Synergistaceae bacterium]|nr:hypothetical protein [Synergistaceae bacterium]